MNYTLIFVFIKIKIGHRDVSPNVIYEVFGKRMTIVGYNEGILHKVFEKGQFYADGLIH